MHSKIIVFGFSLILSCSNQRFAGSNSSSGGKSPQSDASPEKPFAEDETLNESGSTTISPTGPIENSPPAILSEQVVLSSPTPVSVAMFGVNFEDSPGQDDDYNDAVLCFNGYFTVSNTAIVSDKDQEIQAVNFSAAGCSLQLELTVLRETELIYRVTFDSKLPNATPISFKAGDRLEVVMISLDEQCGKNARRLMSDSNYAQVRLNTCNKAGI